MKNSSKHNNSGKKSNQYKKNTNSNFYSKNRNNSKRNKSFLTNIDNNHDYLNDHKKGDSYSLSQKRGKPGLKSNKEVSNKARDFHKEHALKRNYDDWI